MVVLLILWQLFSWLEYVPVKGSGDPFVDSSRIVYYWTVIPFSVIGVIISIVALVNKVFANKSAVVITWALLVISVISAIPPVFKIARYVFYPFVS